MQALRSLLPGREPVCFHFKLEREIENTLTILSQSLVQGGEWATGWVEQRTFEDIREKRPTLI